MASQLPFPRRTIPNGGAESVNLTAVRIVFVHQQEAMPEPPNKITQQDHLATGGLLMCCLKLYTVIILVTCCMATMLACLMLHISYTIILLYVFNTNQLQI